MLKNHPLPKLSLPSWEPLKDSTVMWNAKETFAYFKAQGVQIKVISGDNPETVSEIAKQAGIEGAYEP